MTVIKEVGARWLLSQYDYLLNNPDICSKGFAKAGITVAIANPDNISSLPTIVTDPLLIVILINSFFFFFNYKNIGVTISSFGVLDRTNYHTPSTV